MVVLSYLTKLPPEHGWVSDILICILALDLRAVVRAGTYSGTYRWLEIAKRRLTPLRSPVGRHKSGPVLPHKDSATFLVSGGVTCCQFKALRRPNTRPLVSSTSALRWLKKRNRFRSIKMLEACRDKSGDTSNSTPSFRTRW